MEKVYDFLNEKKVEIKRLRPIYIKQKDFENGSFIISKSGHYKLSENIIFNPNPDYDFLPKPNDAKYNTLAYILGFFAVVVISADDVYLDLNGFTISMSEAFALQQRFCAIIELADSPFLPNEGPGKFSNGIKCANNVIIRNGTLGLSSHHGIHGNMMTNVLLENLHIKDFEFVGIALNGGNTMFLNNIKIGSNRRNLPVLATYSAARFNKLYCNVLFNKYSSLLTEEQITTLKDLLGKLEKEMETTFNEVVWKQKVTSKLFGNESGLADGNVYGLVIKDKGFAVNDLVNESQVVSEDKNRTNNIYLRKVHIHKLSFKVDEIVGISGIDGKGVQTDATGAVFQIDKVTNKDGKYIGNVLSDLQLYMNRLTNVKDKLGKFNITDDLYEWSKSDQNIKSVIDKGCKYKCGGDSMFHFNKGIFGMRFDALNTLVLHKCFIHSIENLGFLGNDVFAGHYEKCHDQAKRNGYFGSDSTGLSFSYCSNVNVSKTAIKKITSNNGNACGYYVVYNSNVNVFDSIVKSIYAGIFAKDSCIGTNYYGNNVQFTNTLPNKMPKAMGAYVGKDSEIKFKHTVFEKLNSCEDPVKIYKSDLSN